VFSCRQLPLIREIEDEEQNRHDVNSSVLLGENGVLYGSTAYGGLMGPRCLNGITEAIGCGTVFELTPPTEPGGAWMETILHSFTAQNGEGSDPGQLILSPNGVLFGATGDGGLGTGTIFALKP
jgi:hypothetical protein